jgi:hypothetical protein
MASESETRRILDAHADALTKLPNVVGIGIQRAGTDPQAVVVAVYVRAKVPEAQLKPSDIVPRTLSATISGMRVEAPTRVIAVGDIVPQ